MLQEKIAWCTLTKIFDRFLRDRASSEGGVSFEELIPRHNGRFVAAQAFSHVLALASSGALKVEQQTAYGDISLQLGF